jgi:urease accessory protein UreE
MLRGFGAVLVKLQAAFQPEGGAYSGHHHGASDHDEPK